MFAQHHQATLCRSYSSFSITESTSASGNDRNTCKSSTYGSRLQVPEAEGGSLRQMQKSSGERTAPCGTLCVISRGLKEWNQFGGLHMAPIFQQSTPKMSVSFASQSPDSFFRWWTPTIKSDSKFTRKTVQVSFQRNCFNSSSCLELFKKQSITRTSDSLVRQKNGSVFLTGHLFDKSQLNFKQHQGVLTFGLVIYPRSNSNHTFLQAVCLRDSLQVG